MCCDLSVINISWNEPDRITNLRLMISPVYLSYLTHMGNRILWRRVYTVKSTALIPIACNCASRSLAYSSVCSILLRHWTTIWYDDLCLPCASAYAIRYYPLKIVSRLWLITSYLRMPSYSTSKYILFGMSAWITSWYVYLSPLSYISFNKWSIRINS